MNTLIAIIGATIFALAAVFTLLAAFGLPIGEFTMGGRYKILPTTLRIVAIGSLIVQIFAIFIMLQAGGIMQMWFSPKVIKYICMIFAAYMTINTVMNFFSTSKKEKYVMTPISLIAAICFILLI